MADVKKRLDTNSPGLMFVDETCIDCDTCRQLAPANFVEAGEFSSVGQQPQNQQEMMQAFQALVACPVGSIGSTRPMKEILETAKASYPFELAEGVFYNGFNSAKSFGANSYFIQHSEGNWLIDSPRYVSSLVKAFQKMGGIRYIFLSHEDDVADAHRYAQAFGSTRIIHEADSGAQPGAEWLITGHEPVHVHPEFLLIPVPGHTAGSMILQYRGKFLFTGDHMWWDREEQRLGIPSVYVWNRQQLHRSTERLLEYSFEWVLPGHGDRYHLGSSAMKEEVHRLVASLASQEKIQV